jgi:hypothetical protein
MANTWLYGVVMYMTPSSTSGVVSNEPMIPVWKIHLRCRSSTLPELIWSWATYRVFE